MTEIMVIAVEPRDRAGKGVARATRRAGKVPGVIYGDKKEPVTVAMDLLVLRKLVRDPGYSNKLRELDMNGEKHRVLVRDVQFHPVTDDPIHIDFLRVSDVTRITTWIPVRFLNEDACPGIKRGGVLNIVRHQIECVCRATAIPPSIDIDLTGWNVGDSIHVSAVNLPEGMRPTITDRDFTIATIAAPSGLVSELADAVEEGAGAD